MAALIVADPVKAVASGKNSAWRSNHSWMHWFGEKPPADFPSTGGTGKCGWLSKSGALPFFNGSCITCSKSSDRQTMIEQLTTSTSAF